MSALIIAALLVVGLIALFIVQPSGRYAKLYGRPEDMIDG